MFDLVNVGDSVILVTIRDEICKGVVTFKSDLLNYIVLNEEKWYGHLYVKMITRRD